MNRGWLISGLRLENPQKQNRPKTKNYITEGHKKIQKQDVATPPQPRNGRSWGSRSWDPLGTRPATNIINACSSQPFIPKINQAALF